MESANVRAAISGVSELLRGPGRVSPGNRTGDWAAWHAWVEGTWLLSGHYPGSVEVRDALDTAAGDAMTELTRLRTGLQAEADAEAAEDNQDAGTEPGIFRASFRPAAARRNQDAGTEGTETPGDAAEGPAASAPPAEPKPVTDDPAATGDDLAAAAEQLVKQAGWWRVEYRANRDNDSIRGRSAELHVARGESPAAVCRHWFGRDVDVCYAAILSEEGGDDGDTA